MNGHRTLRSLVPLLDKSDPKFEGPKVVIPVPVHPTSAN